MSSRSYEKAELRCVAAITPFPLWFGGVFSRWLFLLENMAAPIKHFVTVRNGASVKCQVSSVNFQVSGVKCQLSSVRCQVSIVKWQVSSFNCQVSGMGQVSSVRCKVSIVKGQEWGKCQVSIVKCQEWVKCQVQVSSVKCQLSSVRNGASAGVARFGIPGQFSKNLPGFFLVVSVDVF